MINDDDDNDDNDDDDMMQVMVVSLGWCELAEEDLTPENSSKAVNR